MESPERSPKKKPSKILTGRAFVEHRHAVANDVFAQLLVLDDDLCTSDKMKHIYEIRLHDAGTGDAYIPYNDTDLSVDDSMNALAHLEVVKEKCGDMLAAVHERLTKVEQAMARKREERRNIAAEIYTSEKTYCGYLKAMNDMYVAVIITTVIARYMPALSDVLSPGEIKQLFSELGGIIRFSEILQDELLTKTSKWDHSVTTIGDVFIKLASYVKIYTRFCATFSVAQNNFVEFRKRNDVKKMLEKCQRESGVNLDFLSLYIMPVQRPPRLLLLLQALLKNTDLKHPDYDLLVKVVDLMKDVVNHINSGSEEVELMSTMVQINEKIESRELLIVPHRRYVSEIAVNACGPLLSTLAAGKTAAEFSNESIGIIMFLFSDIVLFALPKKKGNRKSIAPESSGSSKNNPVKRGMYQEHARDDLLRVRFVDVDADADRDGTSLLMFALKDDRVVPCLKLTFSSKSDRDGVRDNITDLQIKLCTTNSKTPMADVYRDLCSRPLPSIKGSGSGSGRPDSASSSSSTVKPMTNTAVVTPPPAVNPSTPPPVVNPSTPSPVVNPSTPPPVVNPSSPPPVVNPSSPPPVVNPSSPPPEVPPPVQ